MKGEACMLNGKKFSIGDQLCEEKICYVCRDGSWEARFEDRVFSTGIGIGP